MTELVTVATFGEVLQAQMCRATLVARGIRAFVADEHASTLNPHYVGAASGIRVQVRRADLERARELLSAEEAAAEAEADAVEDEDPDHDDGPRCPRCEARYSYFEWSRSQVLLLLLLLGLPLLFFRKTWHCRRCDHRFLPLSSGERRESPYRRPRRGAQARPGS